MIIAGIHVIRRLLFVVALILNTLIIPGVFNLINLVPVLVFKRSFPIASNTYYLWSKINAWILFRLHPCQWELPNVDNYHQQHSIIISNHKSWLDILIISSLLQPKMPIIFFVMKSSLKWSLPMIGFSSYLFGYPMFSRPSYQAIKHNPALAQADITALKVSFNRTKPYQCYCLFPEGTRINRIDRVLGPPKYTALANLINLMRQQNQPFNIIDIDIVYPKHQASLSEFITQSTRMKIQLTQLDSSSFPDTQRYETDIASRGKFQRYFKRYWQQKAQRMTLS